MSSLFDVPAQLVLALSLAASAGGSGTGAVLEPPTPAALDIFELATIDGPLRFSDAMWLRALKEAATGADADDIAGSIFRTSGGRYYVPAAAERRRILEKRFDVALATRIARAFAERNAVRMQQDLQRPATAGELYIAHLFGPELALRFIKRADAAPKQIAAKAVPELARIAPTLVFARGVSLTLGQVYERLTQPLAGLPVAPTMKPTVIETPAPRAVEAIRPPRDGWWPNVAASVAQPPTQ